MQARTNKGRHAFVQSKHLPPSVNAFLRFFFFLPQQRREIAKKAADARWAGHVKKARKSGRLFTFQTVTTLRGKRAVQFGKKLNDHFKAEDKDRSNRLPDLKYAMEAVRRGTCSPFIQNGEKRLQFLHNFLEDGKKYTMKVIAVSKKKQWQVLTYHRYR